MLFAGGSTDITPERPLPLAGFSNREGEFTRIADRIEANVVVLRANAQIVVLIQADILYVGDRLRNQVTEIVRDLVDPKSLFFVASHTHFSPNVDPELPIIGSVDEDYLATVSEKIGSLVRGVLDSPVREITMTYLTAKADHSVNRRKIRWEVSKGWPPLRRYTSMYPNLSGMKDERIRLIRICAEANTSMTLAVLWNYACHPVSYPDRNAVTAEFPGVVRDNLRAAYSNANLPVLFLPSFSGNIRPRVMDHPPRLRSRLRQKLEGPAFGVFDIDEWHQWSSSLGSVIVKALHDPTYRILGSDLKVARVQFSLAELMTGSVGAKNISLHALNIGGDCIILGISAEPVVEYVRLLEDAIRVRSLVPVGYIDSIYGYLPTADLLPEGGYEVNGFKESFRVVGEFRSDLTEKVVGGCRSICRAICSDLV